MTASTLTDDLKNLSIDELKRLSFQVNDQIARLNKERKVLIWRVVTHDAVTDNFRAEDYEKAVDYLISRIKEFAVSECHAVVEEGNASGWSHSVLNRKIPYIYPCFLSESEYKRDFLAYLN